MDVLLTIDRREAVWIKLEEFLNQDKKKSVNRLINSKDEKESDQLRGRLKLIEFLLSPPADSHTAKVHPRVSADEEGVNG